MAKGKHSPALFEVVHGKRHFDKSATVLRTPNWWFKGRHRGPAAPAAEVGDPPAFADEADPTQAALPPPDREREPATADYESALDDPTSFAMPHPRRRGAPFQVVVDRDRQELFLRVRFTTAIVAGFALLVVIALSYVTGRQLGRGPSMAMATQSSEEVAAGPVEKGVLDVGNRGGTSGIAPSGAGIGAGGISAQPAPARTAEPLVAVPAAAAASAGRQAGAPAAPKSADFENGRRIVGKQYVVIQAYAGDQKRLAEEARDFLLKNGVSCTVEKGVKGWPSEWNSVVSTQGFDRASGPQYDTYISTATRIGEAFAGKSAWKRFDPTPVRWQETN